MSMIISKTSSMNVAFEASRMIESVLDSLEEVVTRKSKEEQPGNEEDKQALGGVVLYIES